MALIARKGKQGHLTLVKGAGGVPRVRAGVRSQAKLSDQERALLIKYCQLAALDGICVGALVGSNQWDIRPMVMQNGELTITRFSDPSSEYQHSEYRILLALSKRLNTLKNIPLNLSYGTTKDQVWVKRTFYKHTFSDTPTEAQTYPVIELHQKCLAILELVNSYHNLSVFHGHINPSNLVWGATGPILFDFGFASLARDRECFNDIAPEVASGGKAGAAADVYGIGLIFKELFIGRETSDEDQIIESMLSNDCSLRPSIKDLIDFFKVRYEQAKPVLSNPESNETQVLVKESIAPIKNVIEEPCIEVVPKHEVEEIQKMKDSAVNLEVRSSINPSDKKRSLVTIVFGLVLLLGGFYAFKMVAGFYTSLQHSRSSNDASTYNDMWLSNQPSQLKIVALAALQDHDIQAQRVIVRNALNGHKALKVQSDLIRIAFDPLWEGELQEQDRLLTLRLAMAALAPEQVGQISSLNKSHPGVVFAIIATLPISKVINQLSGVPITHLASLPAPFGDSFSEYAKIDSKDLSDQGIRALSHLLANQGGDEEIATFFGKELDQLVLFKKLRILTPILLLRPELELPIYSHLLSTSQIFAEMIRWFDDEALAEWDKIERVLKIQILVGQWPERELSFQQYVDLMRFPNKTISEKAREKLHQSYYKGKLTNLLTFFSSPENKLSRHASISILAALSLAGQESPSFYGTWFKANPDPKSVLSILTIRSDAPINDIFNIEGARYLLDLGKSAPHPSFDDFKKLVTHPEDLVRAYAYSKLRRNNPDEFRLLTNMARVEKNQRLSAMIKNLINSKTTPE